MANRVTKWFKTRGLIRLLAKVTGGLLWGIRASWRPVVVAHPAVTALGQQPVLYALWHGRMFALLCAVNPTHTAVLISASNDGDFIAQTVAPLGFTQTIRGSSKRQAAMAVRHIQAAMVQQGLSVAVTVDGPRGPRYTINPNLLRLASQLQVPIVPVAASAKGLWFWQRKSWDHYMGPGLFSQPVVVLGQPVYMPPMLSAAQAQTEANALQQVLLHATQLLDKQVGHTGYW
jgi:lysophospholipid acyltransferase (LPLAT)-like uncharacterized protein